MRTLSELKSRVENTIPLDNEPSQWNCGVLNQYWDQVIEAYQGNLNVVEALHKALIGDVFVRMDDGMEDGLCQDRPFALIHSEGKEYEGEGSTLARAWLAAILSALIDKEKKN